MSADTAPLVSDPNGTPRMMPVSLYFTPEWWDRYYHAHQPRPERASQTALEAMCLDRQRFLFEQFSDVGVGSQAPQLGPGQIATAIRYGFDLVPVCRYPAGTTARGLRLVDRVGPGTR